MLWASRSLHHTGTMSLYNLRMQVCSLGLCGLDPAVLIGLLALPTRIVVRSWLLWSSHMYKSHLIWDLRVL
jgi:hypothetical protein